MTKFRLEFDTDMFENHEKRKELDDYFRGKQNAEKTAGKIGWTREVWYHNIASIFTVVLNPVNDRFFGHIEEMSE